MKAAPDGSRNTTIRGLANPSGTKAPRLKNTAPQAQPAIVPASRHQREGRMKDVFYLIKRIGRTNAAGYRIVR
jgi:hypothetical protein